MPLNFDNQFARLGDRYYVPLKPNPLPDPTLVITNPAILAEIGLDNISQNELVDFISGNHFPAGAEPLAMVYSGHQFGGYSPQLGDGRGLLIGQVASANGQLIDLHLKGAGKTPFSRMGDGRAVLRSCIREFLAGEALYHLGIPTTRAIGVATSTEPVQRETIENASMLLRTAGSHIRFGSFEYFYYTDQHEELKKLCDYTISAHFNEALGTDNPYDSMLKLVAEKTAILIAKWQAFGFAHGVMNTDNMSIIGETFDYGPYGFMERYDPYYICNHSDDRGRYAFNRQPMIAHWNLQALAQALTPLTTNEESAEALDHYQKTFLDNYHTQMCAKLGLAKSHEDDKQLYEDLLDLMEGYTIDYTLFFRDLSHYNTDQSAPIMKRIRSCAKAFEPWLKRYNERLAWEQSNDETRQENMKQINPKYILRNYLAQIAIQASDTGNHDELERLYTVLQNPYDEQPEFEQYAAEPPDWGRDLQISCSS